MMSYLEWGICLMSVYFCWWKYGWGNMEVIKGLRQMVKKLEVILGAPSSTTITTTSSHQHHHPNQLNGVTKWDISSFMSMPISRIHFARRKKITSDTDGLSKDQLVFYKSMLSSYTEPAGSRRHPCEICLENQKQKEEVQENQNDGLINCLDCEERNPENPWYIRRFAFFIHFWKKWYIGIQYHMVSLKDMMEDQRMIDAIEDSARQELKENPKAGSLESLIQKHRQRAERVIINMRAKQARHPYFAIYCRIAAWIIGKTLALIYPKILIDKAQVDTIRKVKETGNPIIYLPVHRSHTDYVLVSWTLFRSGLRAPLVAAGENLNIPVFSLMMKSVGGWFIRRRLDRKDGKKDILYRGIIHTYMTKSLEDDNDLEFFIEGGRTRTGKPCHPKGGLLSIAVDALAKKSVDDIFIVPVNFSYEKLLEGNYIREQLGQPKVKESFASAALGLWNSVQTKFGNARVDFGKPFSMREYIQSYQMTKSPSPMMRMISQESSCSSSDNENNNNNNNNESSFSRKSSFQSQTSRSSICGGSDIYIEDQRDLVNSLAKHVIYDGVKCFTLMSTSAIAFILLYKYRTGAPMEKLIEELEALKADFIRRKHNVIFDGDTREVIEHGLAVLGPALVRRDLVSPHCRFGENIEKIPNSKIRPAQIVLRPVTIVPNVIDLSYYSTCVIPIFAMESVIATSILSTIKEEIASAQVNSSSEIVMMEAELMATCVELCGILHHEFIFNPPCQTLQDTIHNCMKLMQEEGLIRLQSDSTHLENCESEDELLLRGDRRNLIYINSSPESLSRLQFYKGLVKPILDAYSVSCYTLKRLVYCEAQEKQLQMEMLAEVRSQLQQNTIHYGESLGLDSIRNLIKLLVSWQVLEVFTKDSISIYYLNDSFNTEKAVDEVIQRIHRFHF